MLQALIDLLLKLGMLKLILGQQDNYVDRDLVNNNIQDTR